MSLVNYDSAITSLLNALPEFARSGAEWSADLPYDVYGEFASHVSRLIGGQSDQNRSELERAFEFINFLAENGDEAVVNMLQVAVLEVLTDTAQSVAAARGMLRPKARGWFESMLAGWLKPRNG